MRQRVAGKDEIGRTKQRDVNQYTVTMWLVKKGDEKYISTTRISGSNQSTEMLRYGRKSIFILI
jgi:hypothetical protein